jgi:amino acid adenylation domain-containing protein
LRNHWGLTDKFKKLLKDRYEKLLEIESFDDEYTNYLIQKKEKQLEYEKSDRYEKDRDYWTNKYMVVPDITVLKERTSKDISTKARRRTFILPEKLTKKMYEHSRENRISIFSMYMTALSMYINRIKGKEKLNLGTVFLNRSDKAEKNTAGMFVTTVPIALDINNKDNFDEFSKKVTSELMSSMKHQRYPFTVLQEEIRKKFNTDEALFDIILSYQNAKFAKGDNFEITTRWHFNGYQTNSLTIHINDRDTDEILIVDYDYLEDLFYEKEIDFIHDNIIRLLWHALDDSKKEIVKVEMVSEKEKNKILNKFNDTECDYPKEKTLDQVFEEQAVKTPDNIAAIYKQNSITYKELDAKSNQLAHKLKEKGVKPDDIVGVMLYRSLEMIISILAIIKAGGAYMPIDPDYPEDRIKYMIDNSQSKLILSTKSIVSKIADVDYIDVENKEIYKSNSAKVQKEHNSRNLAYVIYTSGSTGKPKGAMIEHYSVINRINWMQKRYPLDETDVILQKTPYTFDVSVWEMFWWSFVGAKVCFLEPGGQKYPDKIINEVSKNRVTVMHFVPSMLNAFLEYIENYGDYNSLTTLKQVFASGEALTVNQVKKFNHIINKKYSTKLSNLYGPTEATVDVSYYDCAEDDNFRVIPIGKPIDNIQLYILDKHYNILPIGAVGELYIAGDGLARGYVNNPELTDEKFVDNPFRKGYRMYKTGDLARWMSEGDIEYLGRIDHQIKIRGFRVELGEIETHMVSFQGIKEAVVIDKDDEAGNKYLCAYYVADKEIDIKKLKTALGAKMPQYMVPSYYIGLNSIPLSSNGKIDRKALPKVDIVQTDENIEKDEPTNKIETIVICEIEKILNSKYIGINDNFFSKGIDSLSIITLQTSLLKRDISVNTEDFYKYQTVKSLAEFLYTKAANSVYKPLIKLNESCNKTDKISVICFPYGGGNFSIYKKLSDELYKDDDRYEVYGVNLRGHDSYLNNEDVVPIEESIKEISNFIKENITGKIILYGHCVGNATLLGVAKELLSSNIKIKKVYLGAILPPKFSHYLGKNFNPWAISTDKMILRFLSRIGGPEFERLEKKDKAHFIQVFRHDVKEYYKYFYNANSQKLKLDIPAISIIAENDFMTKSGLKNEKSEWAKYFTKSNKIIIHNAEHYFIKNNAREIAQIIKEG